MSKKLEQKQQRRLAEERRLQEERRAALKRNALTIGAAVVVATIVIVFIVIQRQQGEGLVPENVGVSAEEANCGEVEKHEDQGRSHITAGAPHEPYNTSPPTSGPHHEIPSDTGFYQDPIPPETLVHNLEHGMIVIWYTPDADAEMLDDLDGLVAQEPQATIASPYADIESPYQIVLTAWRTAQACEQISQEVVDDFRREFQGEAPEGEIAGPFDG